MRRVMGLTCVAIGLMACEASGAVLPQPPAAPASQEVKPKVPLREAKSVRISGGLDCKLVSDTIIAAVDEAERVAAPALIIELSGVVAYREDVVRDVLMRLKSLLVPIVVWDGSPGSKGLGAMTCRGGAMLMLAAKASGTRVTLAIGAEEPETRTLPAKTNLSLVRADLRELLAPSTKARGVQREAIDLLVGSRARLWLTPQGAGAVVARIVAGDVPPEATTGVKPRELTSGVPTAEKEVRSGPMAWNDVRDIFRFEQGNGSEQMLADLGAKLPSKSPEVVRGGIEVMWAEAKATHDALKARAVKFKDSDKTLAAQAAEVQAVIAGVDALAATLERYPEIAMLPAPESVDVGSKASTNTTAWRTKLRALKDRAVKQGDKLRSK